MILITIMMSVIMPIVFNCKMCGLSLGEMNKGKLKNKSVLLCIDCWNRAKIAIDISKHANESMPDFLKKLFD